MDQTDFEKTKSAIKQASDKITYNRATIDSEINKLKELGFTSNDPVGEAEKWLDDTEPQLDESESKIKTLKSEVITEHNRIVMDTVEVVEITE